jgi:uncharacterized membrane protein YccC
MDGLAGLAAAVAFAALIWPRGASRRACPTARARFGCARSALHYASAGRIRLVA